MAKAATEKKLNLEETLKKLEKDYGKGAVINGANLEKYDEVVSTGSLGLDIATGIGGIPIGRLGKVIEMYGWESSGKSTLSQTILGNYQKMGKKKAIYVDGENSLETEYSSKLGVDLEDLLIIQLDPSAGEGAYNKMEALVETGEIGLVIIDSYNSLQPKKIVDGEVGDNNLGLHARMLGQAVMKANTLCGQYGCTFIFIGQLREKIGVMFGSPETTQGGNALKFYTHMRFDVGRSMTNDNSVFVDGNVKGQKIGNLHKVKVIKNKLGSPFKKAEFNIIYGEGIDKYNEIVEIGHDLGLLKKYGESITFEGNKQSTEEFIQLLRDNEELYQDLRKQALILTHIISSDIIGEGFPLPKGVEPFNFEKLDKDIKGMFPLNKENAETDQIPVV